MGTQTDWNLAAAALAGTKVCGCPGNITTGQKFHRLVNYYLTVTGQPNVTDPPPLLPNMAALESIQRLTIGTGGPIFQINTGWSLLLTGNVAILQTGAGNGNPQVDAPDAIILPTDPLFAPLAALGDNPQQKYCLFQSNGYPLGELTCAVTTTPT
jgi:hypothetical protein